MNYKEAIDYLFTSTPMFHKIGSAAYKEGLENTIALDNFFGNPHKKFNTIHIGGTNGKGSTSNIIAAALQMQGYKVGLYTSPHLFSFRERIRVNGTMISESFVADFVTQNKSFFEPLQPSFFELTTAMAFHYFATQKVDIAIIEVGLGGLLDCTNIISPILSVITNISFDHTSLLGNTLEKIAVQKAGIIKKDTPVVIGETVAETKNVFIETAISKRAPITFAEDFKFNQKHIDLCELKGYCQKYNIRTCDTIVRVLNDISNKTNITIDEDSYTKALANVCNITGIMGRWQKIQESPTTICDTGHNKAGWEYIVKQLTDISEKHKLHIIFGMVDDKDINSVLSMLPKKATYYFTQADNHRAIPAEIIKEKAMLLGLKGVSFDNVNMAFSQAKANVSDNDVIFIGGSNYIIGELDLPLTSS